MSVVTVGVSHKTAAVDLREKVALSTGKISGILSDLTARDEIDEAVALSTCNRSELYLAGPDPAAAEQHAHEVLVRHSRVGERELACARYLLRDDQASRHLFRVAASLDSMVLGESEIQGQVRDAWEQAMALGASGAQLNRLFRGALEVGKQVRSETAIGRGAVSVSSAAVDLARATLGDLSRSSVLVLGAGRMAEATTRALVDHGAAGVVVANRTASTARALAERVGGRGVDLAHVGPELEIADIVISSTNAPHLILKREDLASVVERRQERPMLLIDISVPRDLDPQLAGLSGVTLHDIDALERVVESNLNGRRREVDRGEVIVADAVARFAAWRAGAASAPTIRSLRARAEQIRSGEIARIGSRLEDLSGEQRATVEALSKSIVNSLLHDPTVRARRAMRDPDGRRHIESLRYLFDLTDEL